MFFCPKPFCVLIPVLVIRLFTHCFLSAMLGGQAAYDLMVKNIPGMKKLQPNESDVTSEINGPALALNWKPSLEEVEKDGEEKTGTSSDEDDGASLWRKLMAAPSLGQKPMEQQLAIEDRRQLAIEDALPGLKSHGYNGKSPHGHDGLKSDGSKTFPHGQDGLKSFESKVEPPAGQNESKFVPGGQDGLQSDGKDSLHHGPAVLAIQDQMVKSEADQNEVEEPAKKKKKTFASRYRPNALQRGLKWDAIRSAFDKHIYPKVYSPSTVENEFYKMCVARLDQVNDESMYSEEAELCSFTWLKDNAGLLK